MKPIAPLRSAIVKARADLKVAVEQSRKLATNWLVMVHAVTPVLLGGVLVVLVASWIISQVPGPFHEHHRSFAVFMAAAAVVTFVGVELPVWVARTTRRSELVALAFGMCYGATFWIMVVVLLRDDPVTFFRDHAYDPIAAAGLVAAVAYFATDKWRVTRTLWPGGTLAVVGCITAFSAGGSWLDTAICGVFGAWLALVFFASPLGIEVRQIFLSTGPAATTVIAPTPEGDIAGNDVPAGKDPSTGRSR